ncbi:MAG: hypothetical protein OEY52_17100 [Gammaproteobacteria bacterium]|nr:hypothetical protein [Gammaproteobacteria bacterium]
MSDIMKCPECGSTDGYFRDCDFKGYGHVVYKFGSDDGNPEPSEITVTNEDDIMYCMKCGWRIGRA